MTLPRSRLLGLVTLALALTFGPASALAADAAASDVTHAVAFVNGDPIARAELEFEKLQHRAAVAGSAAASAAGLDPGDDAFWADSPDPRSPAARLRRRALDVLLRLTLERALMREHGVPYPGSFAELVASLERENARRASVVAGGGVIFGPRRFSLGVWRDHVHDNAVIELKRRLVTQGVIALTAEAIAARLATWQRDGTVRPAATLDDCREAIRTRLVDEAFTALISERVLAAKIVSPPADILPTGSAPGFKAKPAQTDYRRTGG